MSEETLPAGVDKALDRSLDKHLDDFEKPTETLPDYIPDAFEVPHLTAKLFGVRKAEILAAQYKNPFLSGILFFSIFLCAYTYGLDGTVRGTFQNYATSSYSQHSLVAAVNVIRGVVAAAAQPTYARLADYFGRLELTVVAVLFYVVGTIIESQAFDVQRFAGGAVLYQIGYTGIQLLLEVTISDFTYLNWRMLMSFVPALPFIINTWISGDVASALLRGHKWSYCIAIWSFIFPLATLPLGCCFLHMRIMVRNLPEWRQVCQEEREHWGYDHTESFFRRQWNMAKKYTVELFWELDIIGVLFVILVFGLILTPFTLAGGKVSNVQKASTAWGKGYIIAPLCVGFVLIPFFILWEAKFSRFPIVPLPLIRDRGVWAALIVAVFVNLVWYMPNDYMYTVLIVGMRASVKAALRITSLYSFVSVITGSFVGMAMVYVKRSKGFVLFGTSMWFVALGLLLHYRGDNDGVNSQLYQNGVIAGLCMMGFGAGFFTYTVQLLIQTCTNHEYMAIVLSLYLALYNIGLALGLAISGAIWTQLMYNQMIKQMNKLGVSDAETLAYSAYKQPYDFIIKNTWGTPARVAVVLAYANIQRKLCIVGLCLVVPLFFVSFFLRDHKLEKVQSLDESHKPHDGHLGERPETKDIVVVNDYDQDPILIFLKKTFKRFRKN